MQQRWACDMLIERCFMNTRALLAIVLGGCAVGGLGTAGHQPVGPSTLTPPAPSAKTEASLDLTTTEGLKQINGAWRYMEAGIIEVDGKTKDGKAVKTHDITPHAGGIDFDDSSWPTLSTDDIHHAIGGGKLSFAWFRINITVPENIGGVSTDNAAVLLEVTIDDYAEVWVEGKLPRKLGQAGGTMIKGFNAPNRVLLSEHAKPGQIFHIAVFGANGPMSDPPGNFVWLRDASLKVCKAGAVGQGCKPD
jgi:gluconolactonase